MSGAAAAPASPEGSVFAGADVCALAGLALPDGAARPLFEHDEWDFTAVIGLPVQMRPNQRRFIFSAIIDPRWRLVAKELIAAMLAPRHEAVAPLPRAYRVPVHLGTASGRLAELTRWLNWLTARGVTSLGEVDDECCQAYLAGRRHVRDQRGQVIGEHSPATRRAAAQVAVDLLNYRELFTADRPGPHLRPWGGASPSAVAQMPSGRQGNTTPPVSDTVLQPLLAAGLYLVTTLGPHVAALHRDIQAAGNLPARDLPAPGQRARPKDPVTGLAAVLEHHRSTGEALPELHDAAQRDRIAHGWDRADPLLAVNLDAIARDAGFTRFEPRWLPRLRQDIQQTLRSAGAEKPWARAAEAVTRADGQGTVPWTAPLHRSEARALIGIARTAAILVIAAVSGMRSSELMELRAGCRRPAQEAAPGLARYRLASRIVKGQPLGGTPDQWIVIEPVYQAVGLAEQLHRDPAEGALLFGRFAFDVRYHWLRGWVNGPAGQRLGLAPIPDGPVTLRMLRRSLSIELAYRPGGVLASKIHLKHVSVATTEGYAARPGGAQAELLAEVNKHEADLKLQIALAEFRNYQAGIMPAGPGAAELTAFFAHIDGLTTTTGDAQAPAVQHTDRDILNLLSKRAATLHLGIANYCWFADPSRALCLKLAGTPDATTPLAGMCDSARCPQATHHAVHRPVWVRHAESTTAFLGALGPTRRTERARLQDDLSRALRVIAGIDAATTTLGEEPCG